MAQYLIVIRLAGYAKEHVRGRLYIAARRFKIRGITKDGPLPEVRLCGPLNTAREAELVDAVADVASRFELVSFRLAGFRHFEVSRRWLVFSQGMRGIFLEVEPSSNLERLRQELELRLQPLCESEVEGAGDFRYRALVDFKDIDDGFDRVLDFLGNDDEGNISQRVLRLTLLREGEVFCEYDLINRRVIKRLAPAKDRQYLKKTMKILKQTHEETLQPIWLKAYGIARPGRRLRQVTLVEDNPAIRLPRLFQVSMPSFGGGKPADKTRQITLVEDDPSIRLPKIFHVNGPKSRKRTGRPSGYSQSRLEYDVSAGGWGYGLPSIRMPDVLRRIKRRKSKD